MFNATEFFPTPNALLDKITSGLDWKYIGSVLEPSAGKGNIAEYVERQLKQDYYRRYDDVDIDCIEINKELQDTLKGKNFRVVHDDFLTYRTQKHYDLIFMNPPFSNGATHLLKALDMQKNGGNVICILNAETIKNPYSNERKVLTKKLQELGADIQYYQGAFESAENPTGVEIAVIKVTITEPVRESAIFSEMRKKIYAENAYSDITQLAPNDFIEASVAMYNLEVESGIRLIEEYRAMEPHLLNSLKDSAYNKPILELKLNGKDLSVNGYVKTVRMKYWTALFENEKFTGNMTSNLREEYRSKVMELANYDFSVFNIKTIQVEMSKNLVKGIEDCIIKLFDELSHQYSWYDSSSNIHYYNGWKTNKAWIINNKVVLPYMNAYDNCFKKYDPTHYGLMQKLADIEKALNYLDGGLTDAHDMGMFLSHAKETGETKKIPLKYFNVTFYKKGTCHIEFTNIELLKKLNIFGSQQKKWLPPAYGKKRYEEMDAEERAVVDEFEGKDSYADTLANTDYYIYDPKSAVPLLDMQESA